MKSPLDRLYFAYGSNLWHAQMEQRCPGSRLVGRGRLRGYRWMIFSQGFANIVPDSSAKVEGLIYELTAEDEAALDYFEGVADGDYDKHWIEILDTDNQLRLCLVYISSDTTPGTARAEYIRRINHGIADAALPADYVEKYLRPFISRSSAAD